MGHCIIFNEVKVGSLVMIILIGLLLILLLFPSFQIITSWPCYLIVKVGPICNDHIMCLSIKSVMRFNVRSMVRGCVITKSVINDLIILSCIDILVRSQSCFNCLYCFFYTELWISFFITLRAENVKVRKERKSTLFSCRSRNCWVSYTSFIGFCLKCCMQSTV